MTVTRRYLKDLVGNEAPGQGPREQETSEERRVVAERRCFVCLEGVYVTQSTIHHRLDSASNGDNDAKSPWHVEACDLCGHVQIFRPDWKRPAS